MNRAEVIITRSLLQKPQKKKKKHFKQHAWKVTDNTTAASATGFCRKTTLNPLKKSRKLFPLPIDHFTVECLVAWPLSESEAGVDPVVVETSI